jgi:hypothetical protein
MSISESGGYVTAVFTLDSFLRVLSLFLVVEATINAFVVVSNYIRSVVIVDTACWDKIGC